MTQTVYTFFKTEPIAWPITSLFVLTVCGFIVRVPQLLRQELPLGKALYQVLRVGSRMVLAALGVAFSAAVAASVSGMLLLCLSYVLCS